MKKILLLIPLLFLNGCMSVSTGLIGKIQAAILAGVPNGSTAKLNIIVQTPYGTATIIGSNIVKTDNEITSTDLEVTITSALQPVVFYHSSGFVPAASAAGFGNTGIMPATTTLKLK